MGVLTSEVGYTIATTRRETTKVHKNMWWHWEKEKRRKKIQYDSLLHQWPNCNSDYIGLDRVGIESGW